MSYTPEQLLEILSNYEKLSGNSLLKNAKEKLDPKAKVRNRGTVCVPAESAKDKKDHFPINDEGQARSALSRVEGLSSAPWYNGSLEGLKALVKRKVHSKFPGIGKDEKKKKSAERLNILSKYAGYKVKSVQIGAIPIKDSFLQKYSEEGQMIDRLIAKYGQQPINFSQEPPGGWATQHTPSTSGIMGKRFFEWTPQELAIREKQEPGFLDKWHSSPQNGIPNDKYDQAQALLRGTPVTSNTNLNQSREYGDKPNLTPAHPVAPSKHAPVVNQQIINVQKNLKHLGLTGADGKPLQIDGIIGKNTRFAIQSYKTEYGMPNTSDKIAMYYILHPDKAKARGYKSQIAGGVAPTKPVAPKPTGDGVNDYWTNNPNK